MVALPPSKSVSCPNIFPNESNELYVVTVPRSLPFVSVLGDEYDITNPSLFIVTEEPVNPAQSSSNISLIFIHALFSLL